MADVRISVYKWLLDVNKPHRGNIQLGLGLKFVSGDYRFQDFFYRTTGTVVAPVKPTLQLGDGGTGITTELNTFYTVSKSINLYANGFYLFNPRDQNGTNNTTGRTPSDIEKQAGADINGVPDAFNVRGVANFRVNNFVFWACVRFEGKPVHDALGNSHGQRRLHSFSGAWNKLQIQESYTFCVRTHATLWHNKTNSGRQKHNSTIRDVSTTPRRDSELSNFPGRIV